MSKGRRGEVSEAKRMVADSAMLARGDAPSNRKQERIRRAEERRLQKKQKPK